MVMLKFVATAVMLIVVAVVILKVMLPEMLMLADQLLVATLEETLMQEVVYDAQENKTK